MTWNVQYAEGFIRDLQEISAYIAEVLQEPQTAKKQTERIFDAADSLDFMPERHPIHTQGRKPTLPIRSFPINNYMIFYQSDEVKSLVKVLRVIYGARDIPVQLEETEES